MTAPLIVEFAGFPGAGKTTIARLAVEALRSAGCTTPTLEEVARLRSFRLGHGGDWWKWLRFGLYCCRNMRVAIVSFGYALAVQPINFRSLEGAYHFMRMMFFFRELRRLEYECVIVDEGLIQYMWAMSVTGAPPDRESARDLLLRTKRSAAGAVVYVDIDADTAVSRISGRRRQRGRFDRSTDAWLMDVYETHERHLRQLVHLAQRVIGQVALRMNGKDPASDNAARIATVVSRAAGSSRTFAGFRA